MLLKAIINITAEYAECDPGEITVETAFADLGLSETDVIDIIMELEDIYMRGIETEKDPETVGELLSAAKASLEE